MPNERHQLNRKDIDSALDEVIHKLRYRIREKGMGSMSSSHEILGIIIQETAEYQEAVHCRQPEEEKVQELLDIAVAALFGVASIRSGGVDS